MNAQQEIKDARNAWLSGSIPGQGNISYNKTIYSFKLLKNYYKDKFTSIIINKLLVNFNLWYYCSRYYLFGLHFKSRK